MGLDMQMSTGMQVRRDMPVSEMQELTELDGTEMLPVIQGNDTDGWNNFKISAGMLGGNGGMAVVKQTASEVTIQPDVLNVWGEVALLTIDLAEGKPGIAHEYCIEFVSGETPTVLSLPAEVVFPEEPTIEANMRYQISIVNNVGLVAGVPHVSQSLL